VDKKKKVTIENAEERFFETALEMHDMTDEAERMRRVRTTGLTDGSSRSHLIFSIIIEAQDKESGKLTRGTWGFYEHSTHFEVKLIVLC
jgi:hypothetical protein